MESKITGGATEKIFCAKILNKYEVAYYKCTETGFIQTEDPYWLEEAYSLAITKLDIGLAGRNEQFRNQIIPILAKNFNQNGRFLDYAGGYGLFTRLMRDKGYDFYHTDPYCKNIFAEYFDLNDLPIDQKFELITAFEVFEHLPNPLVEIEKMNKFADHILFSTVLVPETKLSSAEDWWYFIPETGQHIALYTEKSLSVLGEKFGYHFYTDGISLHLFTKKIFQKNPFKRDRDPFFIRKIRKLANKYDKKNFPERETLLQKDWLYVKSKLH